MRIASGAVGDTILLAPWDGSIDLYRVVGGAAQPASPLVPLGEAWLAGVSIDWERFRADSARAVARHRDRAATVLIGMDTPQVTADLLDRFVDEAFDERAIAHVTGAVDLADLELPEIGRSALGLFFDTAVAIIQVVESDVDALAGQVAYDLLADRVHEDGRAAVAFAMGIGALASGCANMQMPEMSPTARNTAIGAGAVAKAVVFDQFLNAEGAKVTQRTQRRKNSL